MNDCVHKWKLIDKTIFSSRPDKYFDVLIESAKKSANITMPNCFNKVVITFACDLCGKLETKEK